jgi:3-hydroxybutyryl-CoA dehydratase
MLPPQLVERRLLVDRAAIRRYADITEDYNPIHLDPEFAAATPMKGVIAHGMLSLSLIWQSLHDTFGLAFMVDAALDIRFVRPVRENDWVISGGSITDERGTYDVWVRAESGSRSETVISGFVTLGALTAQRDERAEHPGGPA